MRPRSALNGMRCGLWEKQALHKKGDRPQTRGGSKAGSSFG